MNKNRILLVSIVASLSCLSLVGCMTVPAPSNDPGGAPSTNLVTTLDTNAVINSIEVIVPPLVSAGCDHDKNLAPYLTQLSILLRTAAGNGKVDPASISNSLANISIKELRTPESAAIEKTILGFYSVFAGKVVNAKLDQVSWLRPVLVALADAIDAGLPAVGWNSSPMWYEREAPYRQVMVWNRSYPPNRF